MTDAEISVLTAAALERRVPELAGLLHACVHAGAAVNFVLPFPMAEAEAFWRAKVLPPAARGGRSVLLACEGDRVVGSVQLDMDMPPNQPHRGEVTKLLVHPDCRRRGHARALMTALEREARARGRRLITLDTRSGDAAQPLYASIGYRAVGEIPGYSLDSHDPGKLDATTIMYKWLDDAPKAG